MCNCDKDERIKHLQAEIVLLKASLIEAEFIIERANNMIAELKRDK
jgi:hypothetical protein